MKKGLTYVAVVMDESGSMEPVRDETIGGLNTFIEDQKSKPGSCKMTLTKFASSVHSPLFTDRDIKTIEPLTRKDYCPGGSTPLFDAIGTVIDGLGFRLAKLPEEERPEQVIVIIQTDGQENSSRNYNFFQVRDMIEHQKTKYSWNFVFLGADIDAFAQGRMFGIDDKSILSYKKGYSYETFSSVSNYVSTSRSEGKDAAGFSEQDRRVSGGGVAIDPVGSSKTTP